MRFCIVLSKIEMCASGIVTQSYQVSMRAIMHTRSVANIKCDKIDVYTMDIIRAKT